MPREWFKNVWDDSVEIETDRKEKGFSKSEKDGGTVLIFGDDIRCDKGADRENVSSSKIDEINGMILGLGVVMVCDSFAAKRCLRGNTLADNSTSSYNPLLNLRKQIEIL